MRIATMATGGIGGHLAVKLALAGHEVATIARGAHLEAIRAAGLTLNGPDGAQTVRPWIATDDPAAVGPVDAIIFGVKGDALPAAARACLPMIGPDTVVVPFLNGVEAAERLLEVLPAQNVANGIARVSTTVAAPGVIRQTGSFATYIFAERDSRRSDRIAALQAALTGAGVNAPQTTDIERELWTKFVFFAALSGVTAAGRCTVGDILSHPPLLALFRKVLDEAVALGQARGVALPGDLAATICDNLPSMPAAMRASTAIDLENGRPLEIEWVTGAVCRLAAKAGLAAPVNEAIYALLLPYRQGR